MKIPQTLNFVLFVSYFSNSSLVIVYVFSVLNRKRKFPDPKRLLNDDEYRLEAIRETKKALDDLQGYCSSPDCNPWKTILRLKNPVRCDFNLIL